MNQAEDTWQQEHTQMVYVKEHHLDRIIGRRLVKTREDLSMSVEDVAALMGLPTVTVQEHEDAEIPLPLSRIPQLARALEMPLQVLIERLLCPGS